METKKLQFIFGLVLMFVFFTPKVFAAQGTLSFSPQIASYKAGDSFSVNLVADGGGTAFNAAKANVFLSQNLQIQSLTYGNCGFAFVQTPTQNNPSFVGVILGGSSTSCIVYTLTLRPVQSGTGSIVLIDGSLKSYKGANEILYQTKNAAYSISGTAPSAITMSATSDSPIVRNGIKYYTLQVYVVPPPNTPISSLKVILDPNLSVQRAVLSIADVTKPVVFENVPQGIHTIETLSNDQIISKQITTVSGPQKTLVFGISATKPGFPWAMLAAIVGVLLLITAIGFLMYKTLTRMPPTNTPQQPLQA